MHRFAITTAIAAPAASLVFLAMVWIHVGDIHGPSPMPGANVPSTFAGLRGMSVAELDDLLSASCTTPAAAAETSLPALPVKTGSVFIPMSALQSAPTRMKSEIELQTACENGHSRSEVRDGCAKE